MKYFITLIYLNMIVFYSTLYPQSVGASDTIKSKTLQEYMTVVASDIMEGRDTPSRGLDSAARYLAGKLSQLGIAPAGNEGTYFQKIPLRVERLNTAGCFVDVNGERHTYGDFLYSLRYSIKVIQGEVSGNMVYVQDGWFIKSKNRDPYCNVDIKDKIIICSASPADPAARKKTYGGAQDTLLIILLSL